MTEKNTKGEAPEAAEDEGQAPAAGGKKAAPKKAPKKSRADEIRELAAKEGRDLYPEEIREIVESGPKVQATVRKKTNKKDSNYVLLACINGVKWWGVAGKTIEIPEKVARIAYHAGEIVSPVFPPRGLREISPAPTIAIHPDQEADEDL